MGKSPSVPISLIEKLLGRLLMYLRKASQREFARHEIIPIAVHRSVGRREADVLVLDPEAIGSLAAWC
jgi:hypothetical protein